MFSMANKTLAKKQLDELKERHQDIIAIERSIQELHQMFLDMALIVDQQGELIDRVGEHVDSTAQYTEKAATTMEAAVASKRRGQRCKWIIALVILAVLLGVGIYLVVLFHDGDSGGGSSKNKKGNTNGKSNAPPPATAPPQPGQAPAAPQQQSLPPAAPPAPRLRIMRGRDAARKIASI